MKIVKTLCLFSTFIISLSAATAPVGTIDVAGMNAAQKARVDQYMAQLKIYMANRGSMAMPVLDINGMNAAQKNKVTTFLLANNLADSTSVAGSPTADPVLKADRASTERTLTDLAAHEQSVRDAHGTLPPGYSERATPDLSLKSQQELEALRMAAATQKQQLDDYKADQARSSAGFRPLASPRVPLPLFQSSPAPKVTSSTASNSSQGSPSPQRPVVSQTLSDSRAASLSHRDGKYLNVVGLKLSAPISLANYKKLILDDTTEHAVGRFTDSLKSAGGKAEILTGVKTALPNNNYSPSGFKDKDSKSVKYFGRYIKKDIADFVNNQSQSALLMAVVNAADVGSRYTAHQAVIAAIKAEVEAKVKAYFTDSTANVIDSAAKFVSTGNELAQHLAETVADCLVDTVAESHRAAASASQARNPADYTTPPRPIQQPAE